MVIITINNLQAECAQFRGYRIITIGGEGHTPVIPLAVDELIIDLDKHQACHNVHWSVYTAERAATDKICVDISVTAKEKIVPLWAKFADGRKTKVGQFSNVEDRDSAQDLQSACMAAKNSPTAPLVSPNGAQLDL